MRMSAANAEKKARTKMPAIETLTVHEPYASALIDELKEYETRDWPTKYRGPLAIHAGRNRVSLDYIAPRLAKFQNGTFTCSFESSDLAEVIYIAQSGLMPGKPKLRDKFTLGHVLGIVELVDCIKMTDALIASISRTERTLGHWIPGRFAWQVKVIERFVTPIPAVGQQGIWYWQRPADAQRDSWVESPRNA